MHRQRETRSRTALCVGLAALAATIELAAGPAAAQGSRPRLQILQAEADLEAETLLIQGWYFVWANDDAVVVTLAETALQIPT